MSLKKLTITFQEIEELFNEVNKSIEAGTNDVDLENSITFNSIDTYRSFMTSNKANILSAISKLKPSSVYELAAYLKRKPQHVLADCRSLESHGFIKLTQEEYGRRPLCPELAFEYDVIMIDDKGSMPLAISAKSQRVLSRAVS